MKKELSYYETVKMISEIKKIFEEGLSKRLDLLKVQSPLFVSIQSGLQDQLSGREEAVWFMKDGMKYEIVHSLAKWKREALGKYGFEPGKGILTDMKAIRKDEEIDIIHSMYVEQWDWEKAIRKEDRTIDYLKETVSKIYKTIRQTAIIMRKKYPFLDISLSKSVYFITSQELEDMYKDKTPKEREDLITRKYGAVFIIGIGDKLKSGYSHDHRSPDYDDWKLNGDLLVYDKTIDKVMELTSMGIRVDKESLAYQLKMSKCEDRLKYTYHQKIMHDELPLSIGGGLGISRICMLILGKSHISEVQASCWDFKTCPELMKYQLL